mmetsp:Transcript_8108/g.18976  ORF Transcript_8108/g.18976 Transcript_8108/m.18976 type:complete len:233 (+) Transcript_8108:62-760(+)
MRQKAELLCVVGLVVAAVLCSATGASTFLGPARARSVSHTSRQAAPASKGKPSAPGKADEDDDLLYSEEDEYGDEFDEEEGDYMELDGPPPEVLDGWMKDEMAMALLAQFASEELEGKKMMSFRDVAMLLEVLGLEREQFVAIFSGEGGMMEDEFDDDFLDEEDMDMEQMMARGGRGGPSRGGGRGGGGGERYDDSGRGRGGGGRGGRQNYGGGGGGGGRGRGGGRSRGRYP